MVLFITLHGPVAQLHGAPFFGTIDLHARTSWLYELTTDGSLPDLTASRTRARAYPSYRNVRGGASPSVFALVPAGLRAPAIERT
jgi:hypothetical protein